MLTLDYSKILRYAAIVLVCVTLTYFVSVNGCKKKEIVREVVVLRDSTDQRRVDSLVKANAVLSFNQEELKKSIESIRQQQVFRKTQIKKDYESIQKSDTDSVYNDVRQYLRDWKPED